VEKKGRNFQESNRGGSTNLLEPGRSPDCGSNSSIIPKYIDHCMNPLSKLHTSYLKDTYQFVNNLKVPSHSFSPLNIESLYTNIETHLCLIAIKDIFNKHPDRPDKEIIQLLHITVTQNNFKHHLQLYRCVMGRK